MRDFSLVCFPLLFSYMCLHIPYGVRRGRSLLAIGKGLRYALWPWTILAVMTMAAGDLGFQFPILPPALAAYITLHVMLLYFAIFTVTTVSYRSHVRASGVAALTRAYKASLIASFLAMTTFVVMLTGYWHVPIPFMSYIELAAMLTSVPFTISVAYRLYQYPFMDVFIPRGPLRPDPFGRFHRGFVRWGSRSCGSRLVRCFSPSKRASLTRWVERTFMGLRNRQRAGRAYRHGHPRAHQA